MEEEVIVNGGRLSRISILDSCASSPYQVVMFH